MGCEELVRRSGSCGRRWIPGSSKLGLAAVIMACFWTGAAVAQSTDVYQLSRQLEDLQRDLTRLQQYVYSSPAPSGARTGGGPIDLNPAHRERVEVRLAELERQLRDLTGKVEEATFIAGRTEERLDKLAADMDFRLAALEGGSLPPGGGERPGASIPDPIGQPAGEGRAMEPAPGEPAAEREQTGAAASLLPAGSAAEEYQEAQRLLTQARYDDAETALRRFLERHPDSQLSENAHYWLGETYYVRKRYEEAASAFLDGYKRHSSGSKAPDNLLKLGLSLAALQKGQEACVAINRLLREHPDSPDHIRRRAEQERRTLNCT